jgi:hypothetical protein
VSSQIQPELNPTNPSEEPDNRKRRRFYGRRTIPSMESRRGSELSQA